MRLWARADWRYVAAHFGAYSSALRTPKAISVPIDSREDARPVLDADCAACLRGAGLTVHGDGSARSEWIMRQPPSEAQQHQ